VNDQHLLSIESHSEQVKKKRTMLTHLIHVFCVLGNLGLALHVHDESVHAPTEEIISRC
jgi:hypothetical protein